MILHNDKTLIYTYTLTYWYDMYTFSTFRQKHTYTIADTAEHIIFYKTVA